MFLNHRTLFYLLYSVADWFTPTSSSFNCVSTKLSISLILNLNLVKKHRIKMSNNFFFFKTEIPTSRSG